MWVTSKSLSLRSRVKHVLVKTDFPEQKTVGHCVVGDEGKGQQIPPHTHTLGGGIRPPIGKRGTTPHTCTFIDLTPLPSSLQLTSLAMPRSNVRAMAVARPPGQRRLRGVRLNKKRLFSPWGGWGGGQRRHHVMGLVDRSGNINPKAKYINTFFFLLFFSYKQAKR